MDRHTCDAYPDPTFQFDADSYPYPTFHFDADSDPDPYPQVLHLLENLKILLIFTPSIVSLHSFYLYRQRHIGVIIYNFLDSFSDTL